jgi:hypothetical protein
MAGAVKPLHFQLWLATQPWRVAVWPGYLVAVLAPLVSTAVRLALGDALIGYPFITFFPARRCNFSTGFQTVAARGSQTRWLHSLARTLVYPDWADLRPELA